MIEFFLSSDLHLDYFRPFSTILSNGLTSRLLRIEDTILEGIKKADTQIVVLAGDILNRSKGIDPVLANNVRQFFNRIKGKRVYVLRGNHDCRMSFNGVHCLLKAVLPDEIQYIEEPSSFEVTPHIVFHFVPFDPRVESIKEALEYLKPRYNKLNILFSHFSVEKAYIRDDFSIGNKWEAIRLSNLKKFDYCFLGDIHLSQEVDGLVFYPGSPIQHSFGEEGQTKSTWKVTINDDEIRKEQIVSKAPEFKTIEIFTEDDLDKVREEEKKGNFVRVLSHLKVANKLDLDKVVYHEVPKEVEVDCNTNYQDVVFNYVKEKDEEVLSLLRGVWR